MTDANKALIKSFSVLLQYFFSDSFHSWPKAKSSSANECKSMTEILLRVGPCRHNLKIEFAFFVFVLAKVFKFYSNLETDETKSTLLQKNDISFFCPFFFFLECLKSFKNHLRRFFVARRLVFSGSVTFKMIRILTKSISCDTFFL